MAKTKEPRVNKIRFQPTEKNLLLYLEDIIILPFQYITGGHEVRPVGYISVFGKYNQWATLN